VWKVVQIQQGTTIGFGQEQVLKDAWQGVNAQTESEIIKAISANINGTSKDFVPTALEGLDKFSRCFLSVVESEVVPSVFPHGDLPAGTGYCTQMYTRGNFLPDGNLTIYPLPGLLKARGNPGPTVTSGSQHPVRRTPTPNVGAMRQALPIFYLRRGNFKEKKQCRIVFEQIGKDLYRADTLEEVFSAICDASAGTKYLFKCAAVIDVGPQPYSTCLAQDMCIEMSAPATSYVSLEVWGALQI